MELGKLKSKEGMTILGAAVIDDVMGIIVLSFVIAMHAATGGNAADPVWWVLVKMIAYFGIFIGVGRKAVPWLIRMAAKWEGTETGFAMAIVIALMFAFSAEAFGKVAAITGAYIVGVLIAQEHDIVHKVVERIKVTAYGFFVPIFFVSIGLEADAFKALAASPWLALWIVLAAILTKVIGGGIGVRVVGFDNSESLKVGVGMISRGEVALIVSNIGLAAGVIDNKIFSVMVIMTLATTLVTPLLLRVVFNKTDKRPPAKKSARQPVR